MNKKTFRIALIAAAVLTLTACSSTYKTAHHRHHQQKKR